MKNQVSKGNSDQVKIGWRMYYLTETALRAKKAHVLQIIKTCDALKSKGCDLKLFVARRRNNFNFEGMEEWYHLQNKFTYTSIRALSLGHLTKSTRMKYWAFLLMCATFVLTSFIHILLDKTDKRKIVFVREKKLLSNLSLVLKIKRYPLVFELHGLPDFAHTKREKKLYQKCDLILTTSNYQREQMLKLGLDKSRIFYLRNGYDDDLFGNNYGKNKGSLHYEVSIRKTLGIPEDSTVAMYAGSLDEWKGVDFILNSSQYTNDEIYYVFIGASKKQLEELGVLTSKRIKFIEHVPHSEIPKYLTQADILVMYVPPDGGKLGSFSPIKLLEYMASGKAILAPNLPWISEIISDKHNGILFDPDSCEDLAEKIVLLQREEGLRKNIGINAKNEVKQFSYTNRALNLINLIDKTIMR